MEIKKLISVISQTAALYGFLGWFYVILIAVFVPQALPLPLSHLTLWIRTDTFGILSFIISAIGFFIWRLIE